MTNNRTLVLIPARMAATRLPGKPLLDIAGLPMIVHVMRRAIEAALGRVAVATDAAETRVTDGNTALCWSHHRLLVASACSTGVVSGFTQLRPKPSQHTNTAR